MCLFCAFIGRGHSYDGYVLKYVGIYFRVKYVTRLLFIGALWAYILNTTRNEAGRWRVVKRSVFVDIYIPRRSVNLACGFCVEFSTSCFPLSTKTYRHSSYPGILHLVICYLHYIYKQKSRH